jgi:PilZ domain
MYSASAKIRKEMMDSTVFLEKPAAQGNAIGGNRRQNRRYHLQLEVKWKLIRRRRVLDTGTGRTVDVSSGGILFDAGRHLPEGLNVELSIAWPVLLHNVAPMQLVVAGKIVRGDGHRVAIETVQHEFRTVGIPSERRNVPAGATQKPAMRAGAAMFTALFAGLFAAFVKR